MIRCIESGGLLISMYISVVLAVVHIKMVDLLVLLYFPSFFLETYV